jgi:glycosyltransferase involved in cell wall biosynthesis
MNVAMVSEHASPLATIGGVDAGGQNVHVAALACALAKLGHTVTVYTRRDDPALPRRVAMAPGVTVEHVDAGPPKPIAKDAIYRHVPAFAAELERAWTRARPDVAHAHFWMSALASLEAARSLGIPVVQTFHALGIEKRRHQGVADSSPSERIAQEAFIARTADRIVATSSAEMFELVRMGANVRALRVIPCGVDLERFTPKGDEDRRRAGRMRIVTLSRLVPRKGVDTAIEALAGVPNAELIVAGGGERTGLDGDDEARRLQGIAAANGVALRTSFCGPVARERVPALLRSADAVVCVPWYEPFGIVPLEAMACGIPTIVSAVGGLVDTVVDCVTGFHVPPRDPAALARALNTLRINRVARAAMGRSGAERVRTRYSWSRVAAETSEVYRSVAAAPEALASGT